MFYTVHIVKSSHYYSRCLWDTAGKRKEMETNHQVTYLFPTSSIMYTACNSRKYQTLKPVHIVVKDLAYQLNR